MSEPKSSIGRVSAPGILKTIDIDTVQINVVDHEITIKLGASQTSSAAELYSVIAEGLTGQFLLLELPTPIKALKA